MKVFVTSILTVVLFFLACNNKLKIETNSFNIGEPFALKILETAKMVNGDLQLTLTGLPEDSRCPEDANCIWEGQVRLFLTAAVPAKKENLELKIEKSKMGRVSKSFENYSITVESVMPLTESGVKILKEDYVVTLKVD